VYRDHVVPKRVLTSTKGLTYDVPSIHMVTTAEQVARAVLQNSPYVRCFECLSRQVGLPDTTVRETAQIMIVRENFHVARRVCQICGRTDDVLVSGKTP
jgi:hypothetical protein